MRGVPGRRLWVPAVLSFSSVVGCPSGGDDVADDGPSGSSTTDASTSSATMSTTATSTTMTTAADSSSGESSGAADSSSSADASSSESGGPVSCFDIGTEPDCMAESTCVYLGEFGGCVRNCEMITDLTECAATQFCVVYGETCGYEPIS